MTQPLRALARLLQIVLSARQYMSKACGRKGTSTRHGTGPFPQLSFFFARCLHGDAVWSEAMIRTLLLPHMYTLKPFRIHPSWCNSPPLLNCVCYPRGLRPVSQFSLQRHLCRATRLRSVSFRSWMLLRARVVARLRRLSDAEHSQPAPQQHRVLHPGTNVEYAVHHRFRMLLFGCTTPTTTQAGIALI